MKKKQKQQLIILTIVTLAMICINIGLILNKVMLPKLNNEKVVEEYNNLIQTELSEEEQIRTIKTQEQINQEELETLKSMGEKGRMQFYFSKYISYIESKQYQKAYDLLYDEYKNNYFPEYQEFEKYVKDKYPELMGVEYLALQRQGQYYIFDVNITDMLNTEQEQPVINQKFVIYENGFNDFVLSFQK